MNKALNTEKEITKENDRQLISQAQASRILSLSRQRINQIKGKGAFSTQKLNGEPLNAKLYLDEVLAYKRQPSGRPHGTTKNKSDNIEQQLNVQTEPLALNTSQDSQLETIEHTPLSDATNSQTINSKNSTT